ncbi:NFX1-type zinc finger-containing protein 1-like isoform X2 [Oratosquilla oratoria]|uniref:NFX1-type zinc finger-containing protein 1-like isoform X2 n=1 Tax=Oratosquilla oratoria TaxID=337810 RepID=UPI003F7588CD
MDRGGRRSQSLGNLLPRSEQRGFPQRARSSRGHVRGFQRTRGNQRNYRETEQQNVMGWETSSERGTQRGRPRWENRDANEKRCESLSSKDKSKRNWPIGYKALESTLESPPDVAILSLLSERSGYDILISQNENIRMDLMILLFRVLAHCCKSKSNKESLIALHNKTFITSFINQLSRFLLHVRREQDKVVSFFSYLADVFQSYIVCLTFVAIDKLPELLDSCEMILDSMTFEDHQKQNEIKAKIVSMKKEIDAGRERFEREKVKGNHCHMVEGEPPEDFRELSVIPTGYDFSKTIKPFLRKNIIEGKYRDGEHYLDIQFRLLREDFVRPLRNAILSFRSGTRSKQQDVRIYKNVKVTGSDIVRRELIHFVKLNLPRKFNIESSRRFMHGNLVGFTNNDFETIYFASIQERDVKYLKDGLIGVKFQDSIDDLNLCTQFTMIESKAFFIAYKHVLTALQKLQGDQLPFQENLIKVEKMVNPPAYLGEDARYDLRSMKRMDIMKPIKDKIDFFLNDIDETTEEDYFDLYPHLENVLIQGRGWPSPAELGLDDSQFRAFQSALTRQVAIIQGPPGTGKTFLGLKITQVLLNNIDHWKTEYGSPILVLCYTNHALDQFLEGMENFTRSIVRVGSRCKNPTLEKYQISKLARDLSMDRQIPIAIYQRNQDLGREIESLEYALKKCTSTLKEYQNLEGILPLSTLQTHKIIPQHIEIQLTRIGDERVLSKWLLTGGQFEGVGDVQFASNKQEIVNHQEEAENEWDDVEDLLGMEESERVIEYDLEDTHSNFAHTVSYEIKISGLTTQLEYQEKLLQLHPYDWTIARQIHTLNEQLQALTAGLPKVKNRNGNFIERNRFLDIWELDFYGRWALYHYWVEKLAEKVKAKIGQIEQEFQCKNRELTAVRNSKYLHIMRKAAVVGMTTTAAAQNVLLLQELAPSIVIIEEAAEILESHVISSLSYECQHLIMIGDHQQLRPSTTVYELATKYGLGTSLFERMVKNGVSYETLAYQHRMRPSISRLLVPSVYESLLDHPSVHKYPNVKGVEKNVFFVDHQYLEKEESDDNQSHENQFEAELLMALCRHLVLQGYDPEDITILTPYTGQFFLLRKIQRMHSPCSNVRICVVDNFQGEESKIILLSLVRSNEEGKVGFLRTDNRVCVALSRAKHGLYIAGNMSILCSSSDLWKTINKSLQDEKMIGENLILKCENHPDELITASSGDDIFKKSPEGGCTRSCPKFLPRCGHPCPKVCHVIDKGHEDVRCKLDCPEILCKRDHQCPLKCWQECEPCKVLVRKRLPCGHTDTIPCYVKRKEYDCKEIVDKRIPTCDHVVPMACHKDPQYFKCPLPCDTRLECGHKCRFNCHQTNDPDHEEYRCFADCEENPEGCSKDHKCTKKCYEECGKCMFKVDKVLPCGHEQKNVSCSKPPEEIECRKKCKEFLSCGHKCKKMCFEECGGCMEIVEKTVPSCNHKIEIECHKEASAKHCQNKCTLTLECQHQCKARCCDPCTNECQQIVKTSKKCPKGHAIGLPCYLKYTIADEEAWAYCLEPCGQILDCSHICSGMCGQCLNGRLHMPCGEPCERQLVCGHVCKEKCSKVCPPCQAMCPWKCDHSKCCKKCGIPCAPCKESCNWKCAHHSCSNKCGEACSRKPCKKNCKKKLPCGHDCIGFCGDPCPPQCRVCNQEDLEEFILLGNESDEDARFVLLEDCGHAIEVEGLEFWLEQKKEEIGVKTCPRCHHPIYNNRRYQEIILTTYRDIRAVKSKHFSMKLIIKRKEIEDILKEPNLQRSYPREVGSLLRDLGHSNAVKKKQKYLSDEELHLLHFKANMLKKSSEILENMQKDLSSSKKELYIPRMRFLHSAQTIIREASKCPHLARGKNLLHDLIKRLMALTLQVTEQTQDEYNCELHRIAMLPSYWKLKEKTSNPNVVRLVSQVESAMNPTKKFEKITEKLVVNLMKEAEKYVGGLGISEEDRQEIIKAIGLRQGHWYKCPNGHVYCIGDCGRAVVESRCPECREAIGGTSYRLLSGNVVAHEMI